jgi:quercetin dioxygenase-like cupin family protein
MLIRRIWEESEAERPARKLLVDRSETETTALGYVSVSTGNFTARGFHTDEEEIFVILKGRAILELGGEKQEVGAGDVVYVPRNTVHQMQCISGEKIEYLYFANWPKL